MEKRISFILALTMVCSIVYCITGSGTADVEKTEFNFNEQKGFVTFRITIVTFYLHFLYAFGVMPTLLLKVLKKVCLLLKPDLSHISCIL